MNYYGAPKKSKPFKKTNNGFVFQTFQIKLKILLFIVQCTNILNHSKISGETKSKTLQFQEWVCQIFYEYNGKSMILKTHFTSPSILQTFQTNFNSWK